MNKQKNRTNGHSDGGVITIKNGSLTAVSAILAVLALALIVGLVGLLPVSIRKLDLSGKKVTNLSDEAKEFIKKLDTHIEVCLVSEIGNEDTVIKSFLERIDEASDRIVLSSVDPVLDPTFTAKYSDSELEDNSVIVISDRRAKVIGSYDLYTFTVTDESQGEALGVYRYEEFYTLLQNYSAYFTAGYYSYTQSFDGENILLSAIDYVTSDTLPTALALSGHGEGEISAALLSSLSLDNVETKSLILTSDSEKELSGAGCVIINSPTTDISTSELSMLRGYLSNGGSVILTTSSDATKLENLMALAADYGLIGKSGYVYEEDAENYFGYKDMILPDTSSASSYLGLGSYAAALVSAHPIVISEDGFGGVSYVKLFTSSDTSKFHSGDNEGADSEEVEDASGSYTLGIVASTDNSKLIWISSPYFTDSSVNSYVNGGNNVFFVALCEKLCGKLRSLSIESKAMVEDSLVINQAQAIFWTGIFVAVIPCTIVLIGIFVTIKRKRCK